MAAEPCQRPVGPDRALSTIGAGPMVIPRSSLTVALLLSALWGGLLGWLNLTGDAPVIDRVEATLTDFRMLLRGERTPVAPVVIVAIDDATVEIAGRYPLPRSVLAQMVEKAALQRPKAIVVDILLADEGDDASDRALSQALAKAPTVIAAGAVFPSSVANAPMEGVFAGVPSAERLLLPHPKFMRSASIGVANMETDNNGVPRELPVLFRTSDTVAPALPVKAVALALGTEPVIESGLLQFGDRRIALDRGLRLPIAFYGPRGTIPTVSGAELLKDRIDPSALADQVVVIGATVTGGGDVFPTPFDPVLPGVEVIATAIHHILEADGPRRDEATRSADLAVALFLPMLLVSCLAWRRNALGFSAAGSVVGLWAIASMFAFSNGIWFSAAIPIAAVLPTVLLFGAFQLWQDRSNAARFERQSMMLQRIQAPGYSRLLARNPSFLATPLHLEAAVVFVDLSGFTGLSEELGAIATREIIDKFYDLVDAEVTATGGAITSFMGDGVMILFGLPNATKDDALNAFRCCFRISRRLDGWLSDQQNLKIGYKIGAHFGPVVASRLGRGATQQIATTGDTVNVASRLMDVAALNGSSLAVSAELLNRIGEEIVERASLKGPLDVHVRGRSGALAVWLSS
jgi:adenylate cyclase